MSASSSDSNQYLESQISLEVDNQLKYLLFFNYVWDSKLLKSVFIFKDENTYYYITRLPISPNNLTALDNYVNVYRDLKNIPGEKHIVSPSTMDATIYFTRNIYDLNTLKLLGKLVFGIDESVLAQVQNRGLKYPDAQIFIFDRQGIIFSHTNKEMLGKKIDRVFMNVPDSDTITETEIDGRELFVAAKRISKYELTSVVAVPKHQVFLDLTRSMLQYLEIIILIVLTSLITGLFFSSRVTKPLKDMVGYIKKVKDGQFDTKMPSYKYSELNQLSSVFNKMTDRIQYLINQVYEKQLLLKESELQSLQSQVNPHFLFNILETVSWEARMSKNENIYEMVTSLGQFLRANIYMSRREKVTIGEELQYIEFYLYLQKTRFGDKLDTGLSVEDDSLKGYYLPKLCIQPIVENAVVHGLENKRGKGLITVKIKKENDIIYWEVSDNGMGFDTSNINLHTSETIMRHKKGHTGVGLYNTNRRIKLMYGDEYGLSISSEINKGTLVVVKIPLDREAACDVQGNDCG